MSVYLFLKKGGDVGEKTWIRFKGPTLYHHNIVPPIRNNRNNKKMTLKLFA